jgi:preprotein translocase subunit SecD
LGLNYESGQQAINLTFEPADGAAFDRQIGSLYYQHQVAIVMFGRVLEAPTINATQFNGQATISGLDPQTEANVVAALTG